MDSKPPLPSRVLRAIPPVLFGLLLLAVYADPIFTHRNFVGRDLVAYGLPMEKMVHDAYARGHLPVWSSDLSGGRPLFPNPNAGPLHAVRPLLSVLPFPLAMRLFPVLHWMLAGAGMLLLARSLAVSRPAAWLAASTYVFSGVMVSEVFYLPLQAAAALHPWILWAVVRPGSSFGRKAVPIGFFYGLLFLTGDVFAASIALIASLLWIVLEVPRSSKPRELGALGVGLVLAGLLAAPQILATALLAGETQRAVTGIRLQEALAFTLSPWRLLELVVPYPFGDFWTLDDAAGWGSGVFRGFFVTLYSGAFAVVSFVAIRRARERGARFALSLWLTGAALAIVFWLVPSDWGLRRSWIPLRFPEKFAVAMALAMALMVGLAFDRFRGSARLPSWILRVAVGLAILAGLATAFPDQAGSMAAAAVGASPALARTAGRQLAGALAEAGLLWIATLVALETLRRPGRARVAIAVAILTLVPIVATRRIAHTEHEGSVFPPTAFARTIARRDPHGAFRTIDQMPYFLHSNLALASRAGDPYLTESGRRNWSWATQALWDRGTVLNLDPDRGDFSRLESLRRVSGFAATNRDATPFFSAVGLRFGIRYRDKPSLPGYRRFGGDAFQDWDENPEALPDIRLLEFWREEPGALAALQALPRLGAGEVVLETERSAGGRARPGALRILEKSPERLVLETSSPDPAWLFAVRGYWRHRTIRVDGNAVEGVPAQLAFTAVPIPAGEHRIEWREEIPGIAVSQWGPVLFALVSLTLWVFAGDRRRTVRWPGLNPKESP